VWDLTSASMSFKVGAKSIWDEKGESYGTYMGIETDLWSYYWDGTPRDMLSMDKVKGCLPNFCCCEWCSWDSKFITALGCDCQFPSHLKA